MNRRSATRDIPSGESDDERLGIHCGGEMAKTGVVRVRQSQTLVQVADSVAGVESMRDAWQAAGVSHFESDIDYFLTVVRYSTSVIRPHVVRVSRPGRPDMFGIARVEDRPVDLKLGARTVSQPTVRTVVVTLGGIVGAETPAELELLLEELGRPLRSGDADALVMRRLDWDGLQCAVARRWAGPWRVRGQVLERHWTADPPASLDDHLSAHSKSARSTMRRQDRQLREKYGPALELRRFTDPEQTGDLLRDLETISEKTYQRDMGVGHRTCEITEALTELGLRRGWLRVWILYVNHVPVAYWTGWLYAGTFGSGTTGYDAEYAKDRVGRYTMHRMIEDLARDDDIRVLDLGQGDHGYKKAFRPRQVRESDVIVIARRPRALALGARISLHAFVNNVGRTAAMRSSSARKLVSSWPGGASWVAKMERRRLASELK
ncbi:MAG: GNAT family N-acetyltransferase [Nocardioidaceae bacterium]